MNVGNQYAHINDGSLPCVTCFQLYKDIYSPPKFKIPSSYYKY